MLGRKGVDEYISTLLGKFICLIDIARKRIIEKMYFCHRCELIKIQIRKMKIDL